MCPVKLYVTTFPISGSVSVHSSSVSQTILYAISKPKIIRNSDPITVYTINKKKYRWFAKPMQLFTLYVNVLESSRKKMIRFTCSVFTISFNIIIWLAFILLPRTMMIHFQNTFIAYGTMMCAGGFRCQTFFTYANSFV